MRICLLSLIGQNYIHHDLTPYSHVVEIRNKVAARQSVQIAMRDEGLIP